MTLTIQDVAEAINRGDLDNSLQQVASLVRARERALDVARAATLQVGDEVVLTGNLSPKYLLGMVGTVAGFKGERILVEPNENALRWEPRLRKYINPITKTIAAPAACVAPK